MIEDHETISIEELQDNFDMILERVDDGQGFVIEIDDAPKAILIPYENYLSMVDEIEYLKDPEA